MMARSVKRMEKMIQAVPRACRVGEGKEIRARPKARAAVAPRASKKAMRCMREV
jgi:hypothetical protein